MKIFPYRSPSNSNITWPPIGETFTNLKVSGPDEFETETKTNFTIDDFWYSLGLAENANLFEGNET